MRGDEGRDESRPGRHECPRHQRVKGAGMKVVSAKGDEVSQ
jgi:hypothetical protein